MAVESKLLIILTFYSDCQMDIDEIFKVSCKQFLHTHGGSLMPWLEASGFAKVEYWQ